MEAIESSSNDSDICCNSLNKEIEIINFNLENNEIIIKYDHQDNNGNSCNSENSTEIDLETNTNDNDISEIYSTPSSPGISSSSSVYSSSSSSFSNSSFSNLPEIKQQGISAASISSSSSTTIIVKKKVEGELVKEGHIFKSWRKRWFKIENGFLLYFKSKEETQPIDSIPLRGSRVSKKPFHDRPNTFELIATSMKKVFLLQAKDVNELDFWMDAIAEGKSNSNSTGNNR